MNGGIETRKEEADFFFDVEYVPSATHFSFQTSLITESIKKKKFLQNRGAFILSKVHEIENEHPGLMIFFFKKNSSLIH